MKLSARTTLNMALQGQVTFEGNDTKGIHDQQSRLFQRILLELFYTCYPPTRQKDSLSHLCLIMNKHKLLKIHVSLSPMP